jgi:hypothetical protein
VALAQPILPEPEVQYLAAPRIKRCTFRRLVRIEANEVEGYEVECLYPERRVALPLGDLGSATPICNACEALHIFRPDED